MKRVLLAALWVAGCRFEVPGLEVDAAVILDGGGDDALDAGVDLGPEAIDANQPDLRVVFDLSRAVPDGAVPRRPGFPCDTAGDCNSGFCIDGYCCDELCDPFDPANQCRACNVPGSEGHCVFALDDTDPRGLCDETAASTCGHDGKCDGKGACRLYGAGTLCGPESCTNGFVGAPPTCDGAGHCFPGAVATSCAPYDCALSGGGCATSCSGSGGCAVGATCGSGGLCNGKAGLGATCGSGGDCQSGQCWQTVCCASDCSGSCRSCNQPGAAGLCLNIPAGQDPFDQCAASTRASCGLDGQCDGHGACRKWQMGTPCAARACAKDSTIAPRFCNGGGVCTPAFPVSCGNYSCDPSSGVCFGQPCSSDAQCAGRNTCQKDGQCG